MQENNNLIKAGQDNVTKAKNIIYALKINLNFVYKIIPRLILLMNYSLIGAGAFFLFNFDGYMFLANNSFLIQFLLVNNVYLDPSSKCYLIASTYLGIYVGFYLFK